MKKLFSISLILLLISGLFSGCKKDKGDPPVLPPAESMTINFNEFVSPAKSGEVNPVTKGTENSTWEFSAFVAGSWSLVTAAALVVPAASFKRAVDQVPVYLSKNNWEWKYSVTVGSITYKARLTGQIRTSDVEWKMYLTKEGTGGFTDFLWFEGISDLDGTEGDWILYESNTSPVKILEIHWTKEGSQIGTIKYTYVKNDSFNASYIEYGLTQNTYNAYFNIHYYNGSKFSDVNIEWSTSSHSGRVKSIDYLGDDSWYCWNEQRINITCP